MNAGTIVIGLEVHVQLLTRTKLFCGCSTEFGLPPNSATCPVCLGLPGTLPVLNRRAYDLAVRAGLALHCDIAGFTKWDRKNYFYPDLPKNYQISQYDLPLGTGGWLDIDTAEGRKRIGIQRVHLEEDAGKMLHEKGGSRIDLNRAGTPLLEIVGKPELRSPEEARLYLEELRLLLRELEVSDCEMQEGSLRCDANINLHLPGPDGSVVATPIVEVKNLNSFRGLERAMKYEAQRQAKEFTGAVPQSTGKTTAGWDDERGVTIVQRRKEDVSDYRYFPEPDLVPVVVEAEWVDSMRASLGELPAGRRDRLQAEFGLSPYDADVIARQGRRFSAYFEEVARDAGDAKAASNWMTNQVLQSLNERRGTIETFPLAASGLADLIRRAKSSGLNAQRTREVFAHMLDKSASAEQAIRDLGFEPIADESKLIEIVRRAVAANAKAVADYRKGKVKALDAIKGAVMRETKGLAKTELVQELLIKELES